MESRIPGSIQDRVRVPLWYSLWQFSSSVLLGTLHPKTATLPRTLRATPAHVVRPRGVLLRALSW